MVLIRARLQILLTYLQIAHQRNIEKTPVSKPNNTVFGRTLSLEDGPVNDLYRGIDAIYSSHQNDDKQLAPMLPIIGMSMRLILDVAARKYYEQTNNSKVARDQLYKEFLKKQNKV